MCTAVAWKQYFGRNLDLEHGYGEQITVTPRNYPLNFRRMPTVEHHYAIIGMAHPEDGYPLYYDGTNERGLSLAALNFPGNTVYDTYREEKDNIAPFELPLWLLGRCACVEEAEALLRRINLLQLPFSPKLPLTPLHWLVADSRRSIVVEHLVDGIKIMDNQFHVLTNNPPFPWHETNMANYMHLTNKPAANRWPLPQEAYSRGMGAMGLPGDLSSASRFVKAAFTRCHAVAGKTEEENVSQFFHMLRAVEQQRGCVELQSGVYEITRYSSCCNGETGVYYYATYDNPQITAVDLRREDLNGDAPVFYPLLQNLNIKIQNE